MRFDHIHLKAYGPYTNTRLSLEGPFSILYGPNEAGKSSLLRAVTALLFGVPERTQDNFVHDNAQLRVGATLVRQDGRRLTVTRRKGHKSTLLDPDGATIDESILRAFTGPVDEQLFGTLFCLDHERLRQGGSNILAGGGEAGQSLFEAGTGLLGLRTTLQQLEAEAARLFVPKGTTQPVNRAIRRHGEARTRMKEHLLRGDEWRRLQQDVEAAQEALQQHEARLQEARQATERLSRIHRNHPLLARLQAMHDELAGLGDVPSLAEDASEQRIRLLADLQAARSSLAEAAPVLARLQAARTALVLTPRVLEHAGPIEAAFKDLGAWQEASSDLPSRLQKRQAAETVSWVKAREVRPDLTPDEAEKLRPTASQTSLVRDLLRRQEKLSTLLETARTTLRELEEAVAIDRDRLARLPQPVSLLPLSSALEAVKARGDVEARHRQAQEQWQALRRQIDTALASLPWWQGTAAEFDRLPFPGRETIERFEAERVELHTESRALEGEQQRIETELDKLEADRTRLEATGEVATAARLKAARDRRDEGWRRVRRAYVEHLEPAGDDLLSAYERATAEADRIVDALRADTRRVAEYESLGARIGRLGEERDRLGERRAALAARTQRWQEAWAACWAATGARPATPRECLAWATRREEILRLIRETVQLETAGQTLSREVEDSRRLLKSALSGAGAPAADEDGVRVLLVRAGTVHDELTRRHRQLEDLQSRVAGREAELAVARRRCQEHEQALAGWQSQWQAAIQPLGLAEGLSPAQAGSVLDAMEELFHALDKRHTEQGRIDGIQVRLRAFEEKVRALCETAAPDLWEQPPDRAADALYRRLAAARQAQQQFDTLTEQIGQKQEEVALQQRRADACETGLARLCEAAGCPLEALPLVEQRSTRKRELLAARLGLEAQLTEQNGMTVMQIADEAAQEPRDTLPGRLADMRERVASLEQERQALTARSVELTLRLKAMDGSDRAAAAAQEAQEALTELREGSETYMRLQASAWILRRTIDDYRERHQGPLLTRASELFPLLTRGSFAGVRTTFDEKDRAVLVGVRPDGREVPVDGMSDGTVDQLYLALRLAAIERHLAVSEPLPLIVDDILVHFDDQRARATLRVLEAVSRQTQVLFFTHHQHLVDLARETLSGVQVVPLRESEQPETSVPQPVVAA